MNNKITALPVERDQYGYWTHPEYEKFCDGREHISTDEFNDWMKANGLTWKIVYRDEGDFDPNVDGYDTHHGNLNHLMVMAGSLVLFTILKMARSASGCAQSRAKERSHER